MRDTEPDKHRFDFEGPGWRLSATGLGLAVVVVLAVVAIVYLMQPG
ncbi:hypothetical protein [Brevundimonas subvibrioides]|uniref:Uncharacterized protein n=1 Tax=Brevundimonas subvibrioides (strain ATCC 15264 / DSM 4735 / LMG 14903 / NBRC 16000 / CB 81) TaxID=633149 RepID=D9QNI9_BRESC|nr:hypothetical protein [Brevundimonas subvibrioides]ADL02224.1 hypothetical protein Bresu_2917 [Brevundimonas subvibrioides ATCC 15264]